jgi:hypothetical protein
LAQRLLLLLILGRGIGEELHPQCQRINPVIEGQRTTLNRDAAQLEQQ